MVCLPGIEALVVAELAELGIRGRPAGPGAVAARVSTRELYLANVALGTATRVLVAAATLTARSFATLEERLGQVDLGPWIAPGEAVRLRITSHRSRLVHTGAIEERVRRVLALPSPQEGDDAAALVVVRVDHDRFSFRVDASGAPLHHRGWRGPAAKAPLRETLAAAALRTVGWEPGSPLVDPFAGSGTIPIEAARVAAGVLPGHDRSFAFVRWPSFAPGTWASMAASARASERGRAPIVAADRDAGAVAAARENAERAGVADRIAVAQGAVSRLEPPIDRPGWIVTNPPWGGRIAGGDLRDLYARLGQVVAGRFPGWGVALLVADVRLAHATGLGGEVAWRSHAGPHPVHLVVRPPDAD